MNMQKRIDVFNESMTSAVLTKVEFI